LKSKSGFVTLQEYLNESARSSVLKEDDRNRIYSDAFSEFEKLKAANMHWDVAELTFHIYKELASRSRFANVDYIYIDEVQDLTQMQIALFRYICKNDVNLI
jgi:superfamily I DNA/RNA helicase